MSARPGIFAGLKVLEMGSGAAGPVATRYLAEYGATVVRIESAKRPDFLRVLWLTPDSKHGLDGSPMFVLLNPDKLSVAINMKEPEGVALAKRLAGWADVLCENFAPGPMEKWGMTPDALLELNPRLVFVSGCLFGQTGPHRSYPGFGAQGSALSGFNHLTGWPDRASQGPIGTITDSLSPRYVALAIVGALIERRRTGRGQSIDLAQVETAAYSTSDVLVRYSASGEIVTRCGNRDAHAAPHGIFRCRDRVIASGPHAGESEERWIAIACHADEDWRRLAKLLGERDPGWTDDERFSTLEARKQNEDELEARIGAWTADQEAEDLVRRLQTAGVPAGSVQTFADLHDDPQLAHRGHFEVIGHEHLGPLHFERSGLRFSESEGGYSTPGPHLGAHTRQVLGGLLGLGSDEIAELEAKGVLV